MAEDMHLIKALLDRSISKCPQERVHSPVIEIGSTTSNYILLVCLINTSKFAYITLLFSFLISWFFILTSQTQQRQKEMQ